MRTAFTTEDIEHINKKVNDGFAVRRAEKYQYQNILYTRKSGIDFAFTQKELLEYSKCSNDPIYFIETYCKLMEDDGFVNIKLMDFQKDIINKYNETKDLIFLSSHKVGISTIISLLFLHYLTFNINKNINILSNKSIVSSNLIKTFKMSYMGLPFFLQKGLTHLSQTAVEFENNCKLTSITANNISNINTCDILLIQEFSKINNIEILYSNILDLLNDDCRIIINSQPNGNNLFRELVYKSEVSDGDPDKNEFKTIRSYWWMVPGRDSKWKEDQIKIIGEESFMQNYDLKFITNRRYY